MAKKKAGRPSRKATAASSGLSSELQAILAKKEELEAAIAAEERAKQAEVIEAKKAAVAAAREAVKAAKAKLAKAEKDLAAASGKPARKPARKGASSGRKPRVSADVKKARVAELLKKVGRSVTFSELRAALLDEKLESGAPVFSGPDFASSSKFGAAYLPSGWKVQGERRNAKVVKG
jgi:hypothetical protein